MGKPFGLRKRGSAPAEHRLRTLDGQQAGLPKAAAGCRSPCHAGFDRGTGTGEWPDSFVPILLLMGLRLFPEWLDPSEVRQEV